MLTPILFPLFLQKKDLLPDRKIGILPIFVGPSAQLPHELYGSEVSVAGKLTTLTEMGEA